MRRSPKKRVFFGCLFAAVLLARGVGADERVVVGEGSAPHIVVVSDGAVRFARRSRRGATGCRECFSQVTGWTGRVGVRPVRLRGRPALLPISIWPWTEAAMRAWSRGRPSRERRGLCISWRDQGYGRALFGHD